MATTAPDADKSIKMMKILKKRAEKEGFGKNMLNGWTAQVTGATETGQTQGHYADKDGNKYRTRDEVFKKLRTLSATNEPLNTMKPPEAQETEVHDIVDTTSSKDDKDTRIQSVKTDNRVIAHENAKQLVERFQDILKNRPESLPGILPTRPGVVLGRMLVEKLGRIDTRSAFHNKYFIFPVGFRAKMLFPIGAKDVKATIQINAGGDRPKFSIILEHEQGKPPSVISGFNDEQVMNQVASKLKTPSTATQSFLPSEVLEVVEGLEGALQCKGYKFLVHRNPTKNKTLNKPMSVSLQKDQTSQQDGNKRKLKSVHPQMEKKKIAETMKKKVLKLEGSVKKEQKDQARKLAAATKKRTKAAETEERKQAREAAKLKKQREDEERKLLDKHRAALLKANRERRRDAQEKVQQRFFREEEAADSSVQSSVELSLKQSVEGEKAPLLRQELPSDIGSLLMVWNFLHSFAAPLGLRALPHWSELYDVVLLLSGSQPHNILSSLAVVNTEEQTDPAPLTKTEVETDAMMLDDDEKNVETKDEACTMIVKDEIIKEATMSDEKNETKCEKQDGVQVAVEDIPLSDMVDDMPLVPPESSEDLFNNRAESVMCELCIALVSVSTSHIEDTDPNVKTKTFPLNATTWPEIARRCLVQMLYKQTRQMDASTLIYGPALKSKSSARERLTISLVQQRAMAKFEVLGTQHHPAIVNSEGPNIEESRAQALKNMRFGITRLDELRSQNITMVGKEHDKEIVEPESTRIFTSNKEASLQREDEEDENDEEEEDEGEGDLMKMLVRLSDENDAPDVLKRIAKVLLRLLSVRGMKELGRFQLSNDVSYEDESDALMVEMATEYGLHLIISRVVKSRLLDDKELDESGDDGGTCLLGYQDNWATQEPHAVCALFLEEMRVCFSAARVFGLESNRDEVIVTVEKIIPIFDRLMIDWIYDGLNRPVALLNDDCCSATNTVCSLSPTGAAASFKCGRCEAIYLRNVISPPPDEPSDWFCPNCLTPNPHLPWMISDHHHYPSPVPGPRGGRWGDSMGSPDIFSLFSHVRAEGSDENLVARAVYLLAEDSSHWGVIDRLVVLEALCLCAAAGNALTKYLELSEKSAGDARRKALDGSDDAFRESLRGVGGEGAAALWRVSSQAPKSFWVKQGILQKTHEVDHPQMVAMRIEDEEKLVDVALRHKLDDVQSQKGEESNSNLFDQYANSGNHVCEYCGFSELALCSPMVCGMTREEALRHVQLAHSPIAHLNIIEENIKRKKVRIGFNMNGNQVKATVMRAPFFPRVVSQPEDCAKLEGPTVHEVCALAMLQQLLFSKADQGRHVRLAVVERAIADSGCRIRPLGMTSVLLQLEDESNKAHQGMCWRFPADPNAIFIHSVREDDTTQDKWLYVNDPCELRLIASQLSERSRNLMNLTGDDRSVTSPRSDFGQNWDKVDSWLMKVCLKQTSTSIDDDDESGKDKVKEEESIPQEGGGGPLVGKRKRMDQCDPAAPPGDPNGVTLLTTLTSEIVLPPTSVNIEEDSFNWKAQLQLRQLQAKVIDTKSGGDDFTCDARHFFTTTSEHYYACVVVDKQNTHLIQFDHIEVTFRVKLGRATLLEITSSQPFEDGVFYFESIEEFKVSGDYTLEFCASQKNSSLSPLICSVNVVAKRLPPVVSSSLINLTALKRSGTSIDFAEIRTNKNTEDNGVLDLNSCGVLPNNTLGALKLTLIQIQVQLPRGAQNEAWGGRAVCYNGTQLEWGMAFAEKWRQCCLEANTAEELMEVLLLLEASIDKDWLSASYLANRRPSASSMLRSASVSAIALRIFELDAGIRYTKTGGRHSSRRTAQIPKGMYNEALMDAHFVEEEARYQTRFADPPDVRRKPRRAAVNAIAATANVYKLERQTSDTFLEDDEKKKLAVEKEIQLSKDRSHTSITNEKYEEEDDDEDAEIEDEEDEEDEDEADDEDYEEENVHSRSLSKQIRTLPKKKAVEDEESVEEGEEEEEEEDDDDEEEEQAVEEVDDVAEDRDGEDDEKGGEGDALENHSEGEEEEDGDAEEMVDSNDEDNEDDDQEVDELNQEDTPAPYVPVERPSGKYMAAQRYTQNANGEFSSTCFSILDRISEEAISEPFSYPVDVEAFPDYLNFVDQPMDLTTIRQNVENNKYEAEDAEMFANDVRLVWANCKKYNNEDSRIWDHARRLSVLSEELFERLW